MPRGNAQNLRGAARRKSAAATGRAEIALLAVERDGAAVTFRGLAKAAGVSVDFLYRSPLRDRIEQLRAVQQTRPPVSRAPQTSDTLSHSAVVRALSAQLTRLRQHHHAELAGWRPRSPPRTARTLNCDVASHAAPPPHPIDHSDPAREDIGTESGGKRRKQRPCPVTMRRVG